MEYIDIFPNEEKDNTVLAVSFTSEELLAMGVGEGDVDFDPLYLGKSEFSKIRNLWKDPEYLADFYEKNCEFFKDPFWEGVDEETFVQAVADQSLLVFKEMESLLRNGRLLTKFESLDKENDLRRKRGKPYKIKAKGGDLSGRLLFRFYGIFLDEGTICITGGAIKIVKEMSDAPNTEIELKKMEIVKKDFDVNGVFDKDSFIDYVVCG